MVKSYDLEEAKEILTLFLERSNMRKTPERYAILEAVYKANRHVTADGLFADMESSPFRVCRVTVYNTLELLYKANLVVRHQFETVVEYEFRHSGAFHYHRVCTECGTIEEFKSTVLTKSLELIKVKGFRVEDHALYLYGTCSKCRARISRQNKKIKKKQQ